MKQIFAIAAIAISLVACNDANKTDTTTNMDTTTTMTTTDPSMTTAPTTTAMPVAENGDIMMKDGKMMVMSNSAWVAMDKDMSMSNGTMIMKNGDLKMKNGKMSKMTEGGMMRMNGDMYGADGMMMQDNMMNDQMPDTTTKMN